MSYDTERKIGQSRSDGDASKERSPFAALRRKGIRLPFSYPARGET